MAMTSDCGELPKGDVPSGTRVAIVHDFLVSRGGAERVVLALADAFPDAELYTSLFDPDLTFPGFDADRVRPLGINRFGLLRRNHRASLPVIHRAFTQLTIDADVVVCSTSGFAHHAGSDAPSVVYCHTPPRWLYDSERYLARFGASARWAARLASRGAVRRDADAMGKATQLVTNSSAIASEIADAYAQTPLVVPPPSTLDADLPGDPIRDLAPGFVLCPSRALGYKRLDVLLEAARQSPARSFVHVGTGPDVARLTAEAPPNVRFLGEVTDDQLVWCYRNATCVALTSAEDFGLVPVEAAAFGTPSVVPRARGFLDHITDGHNGVFYEFGDPGGLNGAVDAADGIAVTPPADDPMGTGRFAGQMRSIVADVMQS